MNYGLYLSASGVLTNMYRQDVFANNLANMETPGFKPYIPTIRQRSPESVEDPGAYGLSRNLLDRLGGGVLTGPEKLNFTAGPLRQTGREMDAALTEPDQFFAVQHTDAVSGQVSVRLTRDGSFGRNEQGQLITQTGHLLLDQQDQPITIARQVIPRISTTGEVIDQDGNVVGNLQIARVQSPEQNLRAQGQNLFSFEQGDARQPVETPLLEPGFVEGSAVNAIHTLMSLVSSTKAAAGNASMIQYQDGLMDQAVNTLGRV